MPKDSFTYTDPSTYSVGESPYGTYDNDLEFISETAKNILRKEKIN